jgi:transcriptional regulator with XRE-family HTH domain
MADSRGYSFRIVKANKEADATSPGVMLGRLCITQEIPVASVAEFFGVSRMTIYKWFRGQEKPRKKQLEKIEDVLKRLKNNVHLD